jgi:hypothetical protein
VKTLVEELRGGDPRSIGRVAEVIRIVLRFPDRFGELVQGLSADEALVRMRAADAIEKISAQYPEYLEPYRDVFLSEVAFSKQPGVRWHMAQILPRIARERNDVAKIQLILLEYLKDSSSIVRANAMEAFAELAKHGLLPKARVAKRIQKLTNTGTPAMRARGKRLLRMLSA